MKSQLIIIEEKMIYFEENSKHYMDKDGNEL